MDDNLKSLITAGLTVGLSGTLLYQFKTIPKQLYNKLKQHLVFTVKIYQYDDLFNMIEYWLSKNYHYEYKDVEASVGNLNMNNPNSYLTESSNNSNNIGLIYKQEENILTIKYKNKRIFIVKDKEKLDKAQNIKDIWFRKYKLSGWKAEKQIKNLLEEVYSYYKKETNPNSISVYSNTSYGDWYTGTRVNIKPISKTIINQTKKEFIIKDIDDFLNNQEWYINTCIPYKRGYCFYGPPGTGKTTLALAIANYTKRNIYCLNLNAIEDDSKLPKCFSDIPENSILLIEDIDKIFSGRDNVKDSSKITFSSLLNCLDGAFYRQGLITIITTNYLDKLDEALLRTGRIDIKLEISKPSNIEINKYYEVFFNLPISLEGKFDLKMSDVQEICLKNKLCPEVAKQELINKIICQ